MDGDGDLTPTLNMITTAQSANLDMGLNISEFATLALNTAV